MPDPRASGELVCLVEAGIWMMSFTDDDCLDLALGSILQSAGHGPRRARGGGAAPANVSAESRWKARCPPGLAPCLIRLARLRGVRGGRWRRSPRSAFRIGALIGYFAFPTYPTYDSFPRAVVGSRPASWAPARFSRLSWPHRASRQSPSACSARSSMWRARAHGAAGSTRPSWRLRRLTGLDGFASAWSWALLRPCSC